MPLPQCANNPVQSFESDLTWGKPKRRSVEQNLQLVHASSFFASVAAAAAAAADAAADDDDDDGDDGAQAVLCVCC